MAARVRRSTRGEGLLGADRARALAEALHRGQRDAGAAPLIDLRALRLLTRDKDSQSRPVYLCHIELLARARGPGAGIAHSVKRADLMDRMRHPAIRPDGWSPPYELGLKVLELAAPRPTLARSVTVSEPRAFERGCP